VILVTSSRALRRGWIPLRCRARALWSRADGHWSTESVSGGRTSFTPYLRFRRGGVRWEAKKVKFPRERPGQLMRSSAASTETRRTSLRPSSASRHTALCSGGASTAACCVPNCSLSSSQKVSTSNTSGAGSRRDVVEIECEVASALNLGPIVDELDAMCAALTYALTLPGGAGNRGGRLAKCAS
jgi:hypothetical protein